MLYYSTNHKVQPVTLKEAVIKGPASDNGLFMPERINRFEPTYFDGIDKLTFQEIACDVATKFFGEDIDQDHLREIVYDTLSFDCPLVKVEPGIWSLELFHGPTLAFKDVGARFMARLLRYFLQGNSNMVNVLVATSGDTGSAVANGFLGVEGIRVFVLYPKGKVSEIQEKQFTTLGQNIVAIEIDGTFDDCQSLVKTAFLDQTLNGEMVLTSANSINVARFLPQSFYYFNAYARLREMGAADENNLVFAVPSGNFGNLTAGLFAREMGLPVIKFLSANNENDVVYEYLQSGDYRPRPSVETIANAMDVGTPSNFARILDLFENSHEKISSVMQGFRYDNNQIREVIRKVFADTGYLTDPHGACGIAALHDYLQPGQTGVFLETAHPAKFTGTMQSIVGQEHILMPARLAAFLEGERKSISLSADYDSFRNWLIKYNSSSHL
jgi:threonine synthase